MENNKKQEKKSADKPAKSQSKKDQKEVTEVRAKARFIRVAPRKVRIVINQLRGLEVEKALDYLKFLKKAAVRPVTKLINSAIANAENNYSLDKNDLYIKTIIANDGPFLKRYKPRAYGRSAMIKKRTSHIELVLGVNEGAKAGKKITKAEIKTEQAKEVKVVKPDEVKKEAPKTSGKGPEEKGKSSKGFLKGMFRRKTG